MKHDARLISGALSSRLCSDTLLVLRTHATIKPTITMPSGNSFKDIGRIVVTGEEGITHKIAAPPQIDVADIANIGKTTLLFSDRELIGACVRGPHTVTNAKRAE